MKHPAKARFLYAILIALAAGAYNLLLFVIKKQFFAVSWIGYAFTMLAFALLFVDLFIPKGKFGRYPMFGLPLTLFAVWYFLIQLAFGIVLLCYDEFELTVAWIAETLILLAYCATIVFTLIPKTLVAGQDENAKEKILYIRSMKQAIESIADAVADEGLKSALKLLAEDVRLSDPMSHASLAPLEERIRMNVDSLRDEAASGRITQAKERVPAITQLLRERNRMCMMLK